MNLPTLIPSVEPHDVKSNIIVMNIDKGPGLNITDLQAFLVTKDAMLISHPYSAMFMSANISPQGLRLALTYT